MKKRNLIVIVLLTILVLIPNTIKAKSITTNNNINIEENLYNKLIKIYSKDFVENMSLILKYIVIH